MRRFENLWHKRQLVPIWVLQCIAAGIYMISAGLLLAAAGYIKNNKSDVDSDYTYYGYDADQLVEYAAITGGVILAFCIFTIVFDIVECVLYARRVLSPVTLLVLSVLKLTAWGAYFIISIISAAQGSASWLGLLLSAVLVSTSLSQLIMGARFTHRLRKGTLDNRGTYKPTTGAAGPGGGLEGGAHPGYYAGAVPPQPQVYGGNPFTDTNYKPSSPAPPTYGQGPYDANAYGYAQQGVEMQPQKPAHY